MSFSPGQRNPIMPQPVVLVCGAGSIGCRHVRNLKDLGAHVLLWRERGELLGQAANELAVDPIYDLARGILQADAVVVATATDRHIPIALEVAQAGKGLFIEKPLSHSLEKVAELVRRIDRTQLVVEIGCQLRAHPNLRCLHKLIRNRRDGRLLTYCFVVGQHLAQWRPGTDYRHCYSADGRRGGGALFDLVHEIDLAVWLCGRIRGVYADLRKVSDLQITSEDLANLIIETSGGAVGQIQMDMVSPVYRRSFDLVFESAVYHWDDQVGELLRLAESGTEVVDRVPKEFERNVLFMNHMQHFLRRLTEPSLPPFCSLDDGLHSLKVVMAARHSATCEKRCSIDQGVYSGNEQR